MLKNSSIGFAICTTARKIHQHLTEKFIDYNITPEQWVVLKTLSEQDGISQKEISVIVEKDQNNVKAIVDKLEMKEFIIRKQNANDKRAFSLYVTSKGNILVEELSRLDESMLSEISCEIKEEEINFLYDILNKIQRNICKN
ncbi:MAG: MarR family transcriptional regulator [Fusobacteriaceae bacterium]|jgi:DNA-binding MarR family transcriptional regulator|nr:MarR family transcriptional regulator [Leptotrichiaceae bacterium]MBP9596082.1 MarR family transcriptional regulator [Fusobacteriaceae bacterium]